MKKTKSISIIFLILALVFAITACGNKSKPEDTVNQCFNDIQQGNFNQIGKYLVNYSPEDTEIIDEGNELFNEALKKIEYKILETNIDKGNAIIKTEIIVPDMSELASQMMRLSVEGIIKGQDIESKEFKEQLKEDIDLNSLEKITSEIEIELQQEGNNWFIAGGEEFLEAITGNMLKAIENFQQQTTEN